MGNVKNKISFICFIFLLLSLGFLKFGGTKLNDSDIAHAQIEIKIRPTPIPTVLSTRGYYVDDVVDYIWMRESGRGTNNGKGTWAYSCEQKGLWNELGYLVPNETHCFKNKKEGWETVSKWITVHVFSGQWNIVKALCIYSNSADGCEYGGTFLKYIHSK